MAIKEGFPIHGEVILRYENIFKKDSIQFVTQKWKGVHKAQLEKKSTITPLPTKTSVNQWAPMINLGSVRMRAYTIAYAPRRLPAKKV